MTGKQKRHGSRKAGRYGKAYPSPSLMPRSNGRQSSREAHRDRVEQSHMGRTVGVRSIQRMIAKKKRTPDYRHRGLDREDPKHPGTIARAARREAKREAHRNNVKLAASEAHYRATHGGARGR